MKNNVKVDMYTIIMRIQDDESTDYECPFEAHFQNENMAKEAFNAILKHRGYWNDLIIKKYGISESQHPWIQLFLTEDSIDYEADTEEYWNSYEVL